MTPEVFAEWLRRLGHRVVRTQSSYWFDQGPRVFQAFPYHWVIRPSEEELREFLLQERAIGLRYSTPLEAEEGSCSYHIVYERPAYGFPDVDPSVRSKVRRGLEASQVGPIPLARYAREGWSIERDTLDRQHRHSRRGHGDWSRMVAAAEDLPGFEVWGAEVEGRLGATLMFAQVDDAIDLLYQQSRREYLPLRVNNALLFEATRVLAARPGIHLIHNGLHSLDAPASVDHFKVRLGYAIKPIRQRVVFHPRLAPWFGPATAGTLARLAGLYPQSEFIRKAEGLTRFHCNGQLALNRQTFPELLEPDRETLCRRLDLPFPSSAEAPELEGGKVRISPGTPADLATLTALHLACFSEDDHLALMLGRPFIRAVYRWFLTSPDTLVLAARIGDRIVGLTALSSRPYNLPMLRACKGQALLGLLRRPWLAFRPDWLGRLASLLLPRTPPLQGVAQIAFTGVEPEVRGHGVGRALKLASLQACREWGVAAVTTGVRRDNLAARALNARAGFVEIPELSSRRLVQLHLDLGTAGAPLPRADRLATPPAG
jgi:ribosomal protein S18 acetylase RimI-like enzyme